MAIFLDRRWASKSQYRAQVNSASYFGSRLSASINVRADVLYSLGSIDRGRWNGRPFPALNRFQDGRYGPSFSANPAAINNAPIATFNISSAKSNPLGGQQGKRTVAVVLNRYKLDNQGIFLDAFGGPEMVSSFVSGGIHYPVGAVFYGGMSDLRIYSFPLGAEAPYIDKPCILFLEIDLSSIGISPSLWFNNDSAGSAVIRTSAGDTSKPYVESFYSTARAQYMIGNPNTNYIAEKNTELVGFHTFIGTLSAGERLALVENPWQMYVHPRPILYSFPSGGITIPTLSLPGVQDITATGARPKVTLTF